MLKLVKWAYDLGIRHERIRIASHLQAKAHQSGLNRDVVLDMLRENAKMPKKRAERLDFEIAVSNRVEEIINEMFDSQGDWRPGASLMFPDNLEKK